MCGPMPSIRWSIAERGSSASSPRPPAAAAFTKRFDTVRIVQGDKPTIAISGRTLLVSFAPAAGAAGRASSRAIAFALGKMLSLPEPG